MILSGPLPGDDAVVGKIDGTRHIIYNVNVGTDAPTGATVMIAATPRSSPSVTNRSGRDGITCKISPVFALPSIGAGLLNPVRFAPGEKNGISAHPFHDFTLANFCFVLLGEIIILEEVFFDAVIDPGMIRIFRFW